MNKYNIISDPSVIKGDRTFLTVDSKDWRTPQLLSLETLSKTLPPPPENAGVSNVEFSNQDQEPEAPPGSSIQKAYIAVDENYLYVWVNSRWKRTPLSEWD